MVRGTSSFFAKTVRPDRPGLGGTDFDGFDVTLDSDKIIVIEFSVALHHNFVSLPEGYATLELKRTFVGYTGIKAHFSCRLHGQSKVSRS